MDALVSLTTNEVCFAIYDNCRSGDQVKGKYGRYFLGSSTTLRIFDVTRSSDRANRSEERTEDLTQRQQRDPTPNF